MIGLFTKVGSQLQNHIIIELVEMLLSYNWQILQTLPANEQELQALVKMPTPEEQQFFTTESPSNTIQPASLRRPLFGFLFSYYIEEPKTNQPELQLVAEIGLLEQAVAFRVLRERRCKNGILLQLLVESSEVYDQLLALNIKIKYHAGSKPGRIGSIDSLVRLAGSRQLNLYSASTYATIRKEFMIESPVSVEHRCAQGCLLLRLMRTEECGQEVEVQSVEVMNWLAVGSEAVKRQVVFGLLNGPFRLRAKETYALPFRLEGSLAGVEMPIALTYRFPPEQRTFKMVRDIRGESSE